MVYGYRSQNTAFLACLVRLHCCQNMAPLTVMQLYFENRRKYNFLLKIFGKSVGECWKIVGKNHEKVRKFHSRKK